MSALEADRRHCATHLLCDLGKVISSSGPPGAWRRRGPQVMGRMGSCEGIKYALKTKTPFKVALQTFCELLLPDIVYTLILLWNQKATDRPENFE